MNHLTYVWGIPTSEDFYYKVDTRLELKLKSFLSLSWLSLSNMGVGFLEKFDSLNTDFHGVMIEDPFSYGKRYSSKDIYLY